MGDQSVEVTEEKMDEAQLSKGKAVEAMGEGKYVGNISLNDVFGMRFSSLISLKCQKEYYLKFSLKGQDERNSIVSQ